MSDTEPGGAVAPVPEIAADLAKPARGRLGALEPHPEPTPAEAAVQAWLQDRIANGPIARDEAAWGQLLGALPDLLARLAAPQA